MDVAKNGKGKQGSARVENEYFQKWPRNGPKKLHFLKFPLIFFHGHWRASGKMIFFLPILTLMALLKPESAKYLT